MICFQAVNDTVITVYIRFDLSANEAVCHIVPVSVRNCRRVASHIDLSCFFMLAGTGLRDPQLGIISKRIVNLVSNEVGDVRVPSTTRTAHFFPIEAVVMSKLMDVA